MKHINIDSIVLEMKIAINIINTVIIIIKIFAFFKFVIEVLASNAERIEEEYNLKDPINKSKIITNMYLSKLNLIKLKSYRILIYLICI